MIKDNRPIIEKESYDVAVVGGGIAGVAAAVSAARQGVSVMLIEKKINLGGLATDGQVFDDSIGNCGDFRPKGIGNHYQIPFGALYNKAYPNILAAGRIISAPYGDGWEVARVIPTCALTGEAAGTAAAYCVKTGCGANEAAICFKK